MRRRADVASIVIFFIDAAVSRVRATPSHLVASFRSARLHWPQGPSGARRGLDRSASPPL